MGWGILAIIRTFVLIEAITYSGTGLALHHAVTVDSPGAGVPPLEFSAPPPGGC